MNCTSPLYAPGYDEQMHPSIPHVRKRRYLAERDFSLEYYEESSSVFWKTRAQLTLRSHLIREQNFNVAKNVIFFLGDGMSVPTLTAARIYQGQKHGHKGEESRLSFEEFPHVGLSKVRSDPIETQ